MPQYLPKTQNIVQDILKNHFAEFEEVYENRYAKEYGFEYIIRIKEVVNNFISCGDYTQGIVRIQCTNPDFRNKYFRLFSCKGIFMVREEHHLVMRSFFLTFLMQYSIKSNPQFW